MNKMFVLNNAKPLIYFVGAIQILMKSLVISNEGSIYVLECKVLRIILKITPINRVLFYTFHSTRFQNADDNLKK